MYLLGYDIGSSSVKCSLVDAQSGACKATAFAPKSEAPIKAVNPGWAEQNPEDWWKYLKTATADVLSQSSINVKDIAAIGISYQMHGLVCVDRNQKVLRPAIIWCDSRAVGIGEDAFTQLGRSQCLTHLLNTPGIKGVVLKTYGAGNSPSDPWFTDAIGNAAQRGVVILNVSQCVNGGVHNGLYEPGKRLSAAGAISGNDITSEAAITKMMYLFGLGLNSDSVKNYLGYSLCGEITV